MTDVAYFRDGRDAKSLPEENARQQYIQVVKGVPPEPKKDGSND